MNKKTFSTLGRLSLAGLVMAGSTGAAQAAPVVL